MPVTYVSLSECKGKEISGTRLSEGSDVGSKPHMNSQ